jgi:hypothetical protein
VKPNEALLVITSQGFGKRTPVDDYPLQGRGGQGVITFKTTSKTGVLVSARMVNTTQELMLISEAGIVLRTPVEQISQQGRPTQGVTLMNTEAGDAVAAVTVIDMSNDRTASGELPTGVTATPEGEAEKPPKRAAAKKAGAKGAVKPAAKGKAGAAKPAAKKSAPKAEKKAPPAKAVKKAPAPKATKKPSGGKSPKPGGRSSGKGR